MKTFFKNQMIAVSPLPDRRSPCNGSGGNGGRRHVNNTSVEIETEHLHDAEEADYNLMEALIAKRLRRSSANLQASFEDLVTRFVGNIFSYFLYPIVCFTFYYYLTSPHD